ncbi:MAG: TRAP transporter substrate-binding protein [Lachnospiraceae bacterium]|nr:TRAP transporter substrate-binding protein [Lachnospiraceae bacterium]
MKKLTALIMTSLMISILLCGCGNDPENVRPGKELVLKIGVSTGETDPRNLAAQKFADEISVKTEGRLKAVVYPSGQLGGDAALIDSLGTNSKKVDVIITDASNFATYEPKMGISAQPFLFDDFDMAWAFMDSDVEAEAEELLVKNNMRVLAHYCNGFRCVTNTKHPINTVDDMNGLLIRTPENPVIMATMTALGANPQPLSFSELYPALRQGTYDGQENPIPVIYNNKLYEVQKYLAVTNHIYSGMCFTISENVWKELTPEEQEIVRAAAVSSAKYNREMNRKQTEELLDSLQAAGMEITKPDLEPFADATASVINQNVHVYGKLFDKMEAWREKY